MCGLILLEVFSGATILARRLGGRQPQALLLKANSAHELAELQTYSSVRSRYWITCRDMVGSHARMVSHRQELMELCLPCIPISGRVFW